MWTGIDPGLKGAIVTLHPDGSVEKKVMPLVDGNIDIHTLCTYISELHGHPVTLELIHSIYGTSKGSMFTMGRGLGNVEAALICNGVSFTYTKPYDWQKPVWEEKDMVWKPSRSGKTTVRDTKATSLNCLKRLYPNLDLRYGDNETIHKGRERTKFHDGLVDAALIAHYTKMSCQNTKTIPMP